MDAIEEKPVLDWVDGVFVFRCKYEERKLPKDARFFFHRVRREWISTSARCALQLKDYATQAARAQIVDRLGKFSGSSSYEGHNRRVKSTYRYKT